jgi:hypothetical protein
MEKKQTKCNACDYSLPEGTEEFNPSPCPRCGSHSRLTVMTIDEDTVLATYDSVRAKKFRLSLRSKDKRRSDVFAGHEQSKASGKWYLKERVIDKDKDYYKEKLTDTDTGEVVYCREQKLSEHRGHGSAKKKS